MLTKPPLAGWRHLDWYSPMYWTWSWSARANSRSLSWNSRLLFWGIYWAQMYFQMSSWSWHWLKMFRRWHLAPLSHMCWRLKRNSRWLWWLSRTKWGKRNRTAEAILGTYDLMKVLNYFKNSNFVLQNLIKVTNTVTSTLQIFLKILPIRSLEEQNINIFSKCPICYEKIKQHKILQCYHSFCLNPCLENIVETD